MNVSYYSGLEFELRILHFLMTGVMLYEPHVA